MKIDRMHAELAKSGYRHWVPGEPFIGAPYAVLGISNRGRDYTLGWRFSHTTSRGGQERKGWEESRMRENSLFTAGYLTHALTVG